MEKQKIAVFRHSRSGGRERYDLEGFMMGTLEERILDDITQPGPLRAYREFIVSYCGENYLIKNFLFYYKDGELPVQVPSIVLGRNCPRDPHEVQPDPDYVRP